MAVTRIIKKDGTVMARLTVLIENPCYEKLEDIKKRTGHSFSAIVRSALEDYWTKQCKKEEILEAFFGE